MNLVDLDPNYQRYLRHYITNAGVKPASFHFDISPEDEMFYQAISRSYKNPNVAYFKYIESGRRTRDIFSQIVESVYGGYQNLSSHLEFAAGHGRFTRFLVNELSPDAITVSDIYPDAVDWHRENFNIDGFVSAPRPGDIATPARRYQTISAGSFFSHLPDKLFARWLKYLYSLLEDDGILILSLHSDRQLPAHKSMDGKKIQFYKFSESRTLTHEIYGQTYVTDRYVQKAINKVTRRWNNRSFGHLKKAFYENQDVYVIPRNRNRDLSGLKVNVTPLGGLAGHRVDRQQQEVAVNGWAIDLNEGHDIQRVELHHNDKVIETVSPHEVRPEAAQFFPGAPNEAKNWIIKAALAALADDDILYCRCHSTAGSWCDYYVEF